MGYIALYEGVNGRSFYVLANISN